MREYKSRLSDVEEKKSIRSAIVFGGLTIFVIVLLLIFGIPAFSRFIALFSKNSVTSSSQEVKTILAPPNIEALPQYTKDQNINVKGKAIPALNVKIYFNSSSDETVTDDQGNFSANISLEKGTNTIYAVTIDKNGNQSMPTDKYIVNYLNKEPSLTVNSPSNNQSFYGDKQKNINVSGSTDSGNSITVNDRVAIVESGGKFEIQIILNDGDNQIKVVSTDAAGNKKEIDLKVTFNP